LQIWVLEKAYAALEDNQAVANLASKITQQVKVNAANAGIVGTAMAKANQANADDVALKTQLVGMYQTQRSEEAKLTQVNGQVYQLTLILNQVRQEFRQHNLAPQLVPGAGIPGSGPLMVNDVSVEDAVEQLQLQLQVQVVQSRLRYESASITGHVFESYEDTLQWVAAHCSPEDWQYVMEIPALYSLVRPDGQHHDVMLQDEYNSRKSGYASSTQARLSLSFKMKVPTFFWADRSAKNGNSFSVILDYSKWESTGIRKGFRYQVEDGVRALEPSVS
jgi:hypothetical protein